MPDAGRAEHEISADLLGSSRPCRPKHYTTITGSRRAGELLQAIDHYHDCFVVTCALKLAPAKQSLHQHFDFYNRRRPHTGRDWKTHDMACINRTGSPLAAAA